MEWAATVAVIATATSFAVQIVGIEICFRIISKGNTNDISPAPFVSFFVSACVWLKYGILRNLYSVMLTSSVGAVLQFLYILVYYIYTSKKHLINRLLVLGLVILFSPLVYVTYLEKEADIASRNLGVYCCVLSVLCYASPLATLSDVIRYKSTESMSFPLCLTNFLCGLEWSLYGFAVNDKFVTLPNAFGGILGLIQMSLFMMYGFKRKKGRTTAAITT